MMKFLREEDMFRGRMLPVFLEEYSSQYLMLVEIHGIDNVLKMYDWCFRKLSAMQFGQYLDWDKLMADPTKASLIRWCMEMIYQSDLISQLRIVRRKDDDGRTFRALEVVEPTAEQKERWQPFLSFDGMRYNFIDWYRRVLSEPTCNADIKPEWLGLGDVNVNFDVDSDADFSATNRNRQYDK